MRKLLNTLFVLSDDHYLTLKGETVSILRGKEEVACFPLLTLESIMCFSYAGASPALMGACAEKGIQLSFFSPRGKFLASVFGEMRGNVILRQTQYRLSDNEKACAQIAKSFILGKIYNARWVLERATRDHPQRVPVDKLKEKSAHLAALLPIVEAADSVETIRGLEGEAAQQYFTAFNDLILQQKTVFAFRGRSRRPPLDRVNALLSYTYTILARDCASALSGAGLDPFVGFMHRPRPGRSSLALDLMEELRPVCADRFVLSCINQKMMQEKHFDVQENGAVFLNDVGRKAFFTAWQKRKQEAIKHPFLGEKIQWGLIPYVQALLLARTLRGDLDRYPPFFWK